MKTSLNILVLVLVLGVTTGCPPVQNGTTFEEIMVERAVKFGDGDCRIGIEPGLTGLTEVDPVGLRLLNDADDSGRLLFGRTDLCTIGIDPGGPMGLLLRDPKGIRVLNPTAAADSSIFFGPTDLCAIKIRPQGPDGLTFCDPSGVRVVNPEGDDLAVQLAFGPTDLCRIAVDPSGTPGLLLYDPVGIRVCNPVETDPSRLILGPDDLCAIEVDPLIPGLRLTDPNGIRIVNPDPERDPRIILGDLDDCFIEAQPEIGIIINDPKRLRLATPLVEAAGEIIADEFTTRQIGIQSSRELKKNVKPIANALATIERLNGVTFEWKGEPGGTTDIGFVAEDVAEVLPELVLSKEGRPDALKYPNLVAVTVEGIKEQQRQIETLHEENRMLKENMAAMQQQLAEMARIVSTLQ